MEWMRLGLGRWFIEIELCCLLGGGGAVRVEFWEEGVIGL